MADREGEGEREDPIKRAGGDRDLYDIATWEQRTSLDQLSAAIWGGLVAVARVLVVALALAILLAQVAITGLASSADNYFFVGYVLLSVVPALALAYYVYRSDVTTHEPLGLLVATFLLGVLFANFAVVFNTLFLAPFGVLQGFGLPVVVLLPLYFYLVVGPVEETVKWLAVRLYAYRKPSFDAVIDGAVYGAMAGLGFATIENAIYLTRAYQEAFGAAAVGAAVLPALSENAISRSFAGPGHVIYSAFAGYYLGLAKFNAENRGPIVVKGLFLAAVIHATYNTLVGTVGAVVHGFGGAFAAVPQGIYTFGFIVVYDGFFAYLLYRKLTTYRQTYEAVGASRYDGGEGESEGERAGDSERAGSQDRGDGPDRDGTADADE